MVNPLAASVTSASIGPVSAEPVPPAIFPAAAQQVTAAEQTIGSNISGNAGQQNAQGDPSNPLEKALAIVNNSMQAWSTGIRFDFDEEAQRLIVSITDNQTGEVLRTVPSEAVIRVAKMITQLQGKSIDTQA